MHLRTGKLGLTGTVRRSGLCPELLLLTVSIESPGLVWSRLGKKFIVSAIVHFDILFGDYLQIKLYLERVRSYGGLLNPALKP